MGSWLSPQAIIPLLLLAVGGIGAWYTLRAEVKQLQKEVERIAGIANGTTQSRLARVEREVDDKMRPKLHDLGSELAGVKAWQKLWEMGIDPGSPNPGIDEPRRRR